MCVCVCVCVCVCTHERMHKCVGTCQCVLVPIYIIQVCTHMCKCKKKKKKKKKCVLYICIIFSDTRLFIIIGTIIINNLVSEKIV